MKPGVLAASMDPFGFYSDTIETYVMSRLGATPPGT